MSTARATLPQRQPAAVPAMSRCTARPSDPPSTRDGLDDIADAIVASYAQHPALALLEHRSLPSRDAVYGIVEDLLRLLFPGFLESEAGTTDVATRAAMRVRRIARALRREIESGLRFDGTGATESVAAAAHATLALLEEIPAVRALLASDVEAAYDGDPSARNQEVIVLAYPGLQAIAVQRLAHVLYAARVPFVPRIMTEWAHSRTGIDIHPGAAIGRRFFIDHGTGVVIGETCVIGDNVKIYQGVTLGAQSFAHDESGRVIKGTKRHPDIEDDVTIYSGATILGPVRIGRGSVIGGNVWLTRSIPARTRIVVRPGQQMHVDQPVPDYQI
jgi:serine O-acetyltransferase